MQRKNKLVFLVMVGWTCGAWAFAQSAAAPAQPSQATVTTPNSSANATTTTAANSAIYNDETSISVLPRQFITAVPGVLSSPGPYPGVPVPNTEYAPFAPAMMRRFTMAQVRFVQQTHRKPDKINAVALGPAPKAWTEKDVDILAWWPGDRCYPGDQLLGSIIVTGAPGDPHEATLLRGIAELEKLTHSRRYAVLAKYDRKQKVKALSLGVGATGARITQPGTDNDAVSVSAGIGYGTRSEEVQDVREFYIFAFNDGPIEPPPAPQQQITQVQPVPQLPVQIVRYEVAPIKIEVEPLKIDVSSLPPFLQPQPPSGVVVVPPSTPVLPPAEAACDASGMPELTVLFDFNKALVKSDYAPKIKEFVLWLGAHPKCHIQVEGHTCRSGTFDYDAILGRHRAEAVYNQLIANGGKPEQIGQFVSVSKDRLAYFAFENDPLNRRVILRIIGPASGK